MVKPLIKNTPITSTDGNTYIVNDLIGQGGTSFIYSAYCGFDHFVIKELCPHTYSSIALKRNESSLLIEGDNEGIFEQIKSDFKKEYQQSVSFKSSAHLIKPKCLIKANNTLYIVMPMHHGDVLSEFLRKKRGTLTLDDILTLIIAIARNLQYLHNDESMYHLDLNPGNVFVSNKDWSLGTMLLDFGTSTKTNEIKSLDYITNGYSAPELYNNDPKSVNVSTDLFSLFSILYFMLFAKPYNLQDINGSFFYYAHEPLQKDKLLTLLDTETLATSHGAIKSLIDLLAQALDEDASSRLKSLGTLDHLIILLENLKKDIQHNLKQVNIEKNTSTALKEDLQKYSQLHFSKQVKTEDINKEYFSKIQLHGNPISIVDYIFSMSEDSIMIHGSGGIGKSTTLKFLWGEYLNTEIIPLYIPLRALSSSNTVEQFIMRYIISTYLLNKSIDTNSIDATFSEQTKTLSDLFSNNSDKKEFVFLLDGLNETAYEIQQKFLDDLNDKLNHWTNVRFIMSSRIPLYFPVKMQEFELSGIDESIYSRALEGNTQKLSHFNNELLKLPFYANMILNTKVDHSTLNRSSLLEQSLLIKSDQSSGDKLELSFLHDILLPFVAYKLFTLGIHYIKESYLLELIDEFKSSTQEKTIVSSFPKYRPLFTRKLDTYTLHDAITKEHALLQTTLSGYTFPHQIYRDFYSAKFIVLTLNKSKLFNIEPLALSDSLYELHGFISEMKPHFETVLDQYRSRSDTGHSLVNILEILKLQTDNQLYDFDFSNIDFKNCNLTNTYFSNGLKGASFDHAKLYSHNFEHQQYGSLDKLKMICDGTKLLFKGNDSDMLYLYELDKYTKRFMPLKKTPNNIRITYDHKTSDMIFNHLSTGQLLRYNIEDLPPTFTDTMAFTADYKGFVINKFNHLDLIDLTTFKIRRIERTNVRGGVFVIYDFCDYFIESNIWSSNDDTITLRHFYSDFRLEKVNETRDHEADQSYSIIIGRNYVNNRYVHISSSAPGRDFQLFFDIESKEDLAEDFDHFDTTLHTYNNQLYRLKDSKLVDLYSEESILVDFLSLGIDLSSYDSSITIGAVFYVKKDFTLYAISLQTASLIYSIEFDKEFMNYDISLTDDNNLVFGNFIWNPWNREITNYTKFKKSIETSENVYSYAIWNQHSIYQKHFATELLIDQNEPLDIPQDLIDRLPFSLVNDVNTWFNSKVYKDFLVFETRDYYAISKIEQRKNYDRNAIDIISKESNAIRTIYPMKRLLYNASICFNDLNCIVDNDDSSSGSYSILFLDTEDLVNVELNSSIYINNATFENVTLVDEYSDLVFERISLLERIKRYFSKEKAMQNNHLESLIRQYGGKFN